MGKIRPARRDERRPAFRSNRAASTRHPWPARRTARTAVLEDRLEVESLGVTFEVSDELLRATGSGP